jgi:hypothetical protein
MNPGPPPGSSGRVRITAPQRVTRPRRGTGTEIDAQSAIGEIYMRSLIRAQLRLAISVLGVLALTVGGLPLAFRFLPAVFDEQVFGVPLSWVLLAFAVYPWLVLLAWWYVRSAERNERAFTQVVERP